MKFVIVENRPPGYDQFRKSLSRNAVIHSCAPKSSVKNGLPGKL